MKYLLYVFLFFGSSSFAQDCDLPLGKLPAGDPQASTAEGKDKTEASGFLEDDICETKAMDTLDALLGKATSSDSTPSTQ